jgi:hypothetical protein
MQYKNLLKIAKVNGAEGADQTVTIPRDLFRTLLITALRAKGVFDDDYYLAANPDVRDALRKKEIASAADHYYSTGYFEGRMPKRFLVDEDYYVAENPDVARAIKLKRVKNGQVHFDTNGFEEGRAPYEGFSLF